MLNLERSKSQRYKISSESSNFRPGMVDHSCNPNYYEGRGCEDHSTRPAQAKSYQDPISRKKVVWWHETVIPVT
jgi:hypothetical protein